MPHIVVATAVSYLVGWIGAATGILAYVAVPERMVFTIFLVAYFLMLSIAVRLHKTRSMHSQIRQSIAEAKRQASA